MSVQGDIEAKLTAGLRPVHLEVTNESHQHNVPQGSESHFKVVIVSPQFDDKSLVARHRMVNEILAEELSTKIHALALHTYTEDDWKANYGEAPMSPPCLGGSSAK